MTPESIILMWFFILSSISLFLFFAVTCEWIEEKLEHKINIWIEYRIIQERAA